jgi:PAS domain S-box-containing protein
MELPLATHAPIGSIMLAGSSSAAWHDARRPSLDPEEDCHGHPGGSQAMTIECIEKAKQEWEFVADSIPLLLCLIDRQGRILRTNRTLERWGLGDLAAVKGKTLHQAVHPDCTTPDCALLKFEHQAVRDMVDGRRSHLEGFDPVLRRPVAINVQPILNGEGQVDLADILAVVSVDDVSEMARSEAGVLCLQSSLRACIGHEIAKRQEVEEVQSRLVNLISRTPNFVAIADSDGQLSYLNPAGCAMLGMTEDDAAGLTLADCLTPEAREMLVREALPAAMQEGSWRGPSTLLAGDGCEVPTTQVIVANWSADGKFTGFSVVEQDMSAWVEAETALRSSQKELQRLSAELLDIQEKERRRIAADLHDVLGQSLSLIKLSIDSAARLVDQGETQTARETLHKLGGKVKDALVEVQRVSMNLRPSTLDDLGILATLSWFFREFEATCSHIRVEKAFAVKEENIPRTLKTTIFRILQEATANVVKHAGADHVRVGLAHRDDLLELTVEDNGQGFDPDGLATNGARHSVGLRSMRERARLTGGTWTLESGVGRGTRIRAWWPAAALVGD